MAIDYRFIHPDPELRVWHDLTDAFTILTMNTRNASTAMQHFGVIMSEAMLGRRRRGSA